MIFHIIYCYRERERKRRKGLSPYHSLSHWIFDQRVWPKLSKIETRPIKLYMPTSITWYVCMYRFGARVSMIKLAAKEEDENMHMIRNHMVLLPLLISSFYFFLLRLSFLLLLFLHLIWVLPVAFFFLSRRYCFENVKCVCFKIGWTNENVICDTVGHILDTCAHNTCNARHAECFIHTIWWHTIKSSNLSCQSETYGDGGGERER